MIDLHRTSHLRRRRQPWHRRRIRAHGRQGRCVGDRQLRVQRGCRQPGGRRLPRGRKAWAVKADGSVDGALDKAVDESVKHNGPLSGMVISAGIFEPSKIEEMTAAFWDRMMAINVRATFLAVRAAARHLRAGSKGGSIVIYTSTAGQRGSSVYSAYATSKGAQILFMRSMACELAPKRIRVNCIAPSWTESDMSAKVMDGIGRAKILEGCPLGRVGLPDDVAGATVFLLSDLAGFITGTTVTVDGGIDLRG